MSLTLEPMKQRLDESVHLHSPTNNMVGTILITSIAEQKALH